MCFEEELMMRAFNDWKMKHLCSEIWHRTSMVHELGFVTFLSSYLCNCFKLFHHWLEWFARANYDAKMMSMKVWANDKWCQNLRMWMQIVVRLKKVNVKKHIKLTLHLKDFMGKIKETRWVMCHIIVSQSSLCLTFLDKLIIKIKVKWGSQSVSSLYWVKWTICRCPEETRPSSIVPAWSPEGNFRPLCKTWGTSESLCSSESWRRSWWGAITKSQSLPLQLAKLRPWRFMWLA